jgi:hypothetical protein
MPAVAVSVVDTLKLPSAVENDVNHDSYEFAILSIE